MSSRALCIDEHIVGPRGCKTYRASPCHSNGPHNAGGSVTTEPLSPSHRREAYFVWEMSADLREITGSNTALHPQDWDRDAAAHRHGHPSIDSVLAARGYDEAGNIDA